MFNFRSEGRHFGNSTRCIVPASAFFEFTGKKYPKAKHRFALKGSLITAIAAISRPGQGNQPPSFAMLTTAPGPDVAPYHNRQVVVLRPEDWAAWVHRPRPRPNFCGLFLRMRSKSQRCVRAAGDETSSVSETVLASVSLVRCSATRRHAPAARRGWRLRSTRCRCC